MKNLPLALMYLFVFSLGIYSCVQEDEKVTPKSDTQLELTSPNDFVLADSEAELLRMTQEEVFPSYGEGYVLSIKRIDYKVGKIRTFAEVTYTNKFGNEGNVMFFWNYKDGQTATERSDADADAAHCTGNCNGEETSPCKIKENDVTESMTCYCVGSKGRSSQNAGDCVLVIPSGKQYTCNEDCSPNHHEDNTYDCHAAYFTNGDVICVCNGQDIGGECEKAPERLR